MQVRAEQEEYIGSSSDVTKFKDMMCICMLILTILVGGLYFFLAMVSNQVDKIFIRYTIDRPVLWQKYREDSNVTIWKPAPSWGYEE